jgi:hypothetical protein
MSGSVTRRSKLSSSRPHPGAPVVPSHSDAINTASANSPSQQAREELRSPFRQQPTEPQAVHDYRDPEHLLERGLAGLVSENPLREQRARPATDNPEQMQSTFRCPPATIACSGFVQRVSPKGDCAGTEIERKHAERQPACEDDCSHRDEERACRDEWNDGTRRATGISNSSLTLQTRRSRASQRSRRRSKVLRRSKAMLMRGSSSRSLG